jgi:hypothetical protein
MSLSKPDGLPYSSFQVNAQAYYGAVVRNYPHWQILRRMDLPFLKHEKIFTKEFVSRIAGNYSPEAYIKLGEERSKENLMSFDSICKQFIDYCEELSRIRTFQSVAIEGARIRELWVQYERLSVLIHDNIQTVIMPMLLKLDQCNRELYVSFQYDNFTDAISSCRDFQSLARIVVMHFFEFTCYSDKTQRMKLLELAVRKGKELLPTLPAIVFQQFLLREEHCDCCFWLFLKYYDLAKSMRYNIRYKTTTSGHFLCTEACDALLLSVNEEHTELLRALGQSNAMSALIRRGIREGDYQAASNMLVNVLAEPAKRTRSSKMYIAADTLRGNPRLSYTLYAIDYLITSDVALNLQRARTNDLLMHLSPLFTLDFDCSIALVSGLHPRLGGTREHTKMVRVQGQDGPAGKTKRTQYKSTVVRVGSPLYLLDEGVLKKIWQMVGNHFEILFYNVPRRNKASGKRELAMLNRC